MAKKEVTILNGAIVVEVDDKYDVYEKDLPSDIDNNISWLGSFGIAEKATGKKIKGKVPKYKIQTEDRADKKLYYWTDGKAKEVPSQATIKKDKKKFRTGELELGDPPVGWDR